MINFSVKPSSYTGASDTNGGGYVDVLGATYANFCSSSAGPLYTNIEPTTYGYDSTGLYDITHSMTVPTGVICYCRYADDSASTTLYFYAYLVNADNWQMVYLPVGKTGISSKAVIDDAISNAEAGDELLLLAVGGALASIEAGANLAKANGYTLMIQGPATYVRTAGVTDVVNLVVMSVDENGDLAIGDDRAEEDLATNSIEYGYAYSITTDSSFDYNNMICELYSVTGTPTCLLLYTASVSYHTYIKNIYVKNNESRNFTYLAYAGDLSHNEYGVATNVITDPLYSFVKVRADSPLAIKVIGGMIDSLFFSTARYDRGCIEARGSTIKTSVLNQNVRGVKTTYSNCCFIAVNSSDLLLDYLATGYSFNTYFNRCIFYGYSQIFAGSPLELQKLLRDCAFYDISDVGNSINNLDQGNFTLSADPFVDSANGDYRLNPAGPDFAKLYDATTGRVLIGATGPELTTGTGGTGVCNLIGNGGMIE